MSPAPKKRYPPWVRLTAEREARGLTLTGLSEASGISLGAVSNLESGERWPRPQTTIKLAAALKVSPHVIERTVDEVCA
jgi:transcriptional regulator with XRE-family HTH domain